ncbi:MAG: Bax inhibitor-1/YccA family protein [Bacteroidota bacterium]|nr:Bax inhibitor-1/YccA family protein [Bacteroidota bacterium]
MNIGRSSNPALSTKVFNNKTYANTMSETMTLEGTVNKSILMLVLVMLGAFYTWRLFYNASNAEIGASLIGKWMAIGGIGGFVMSLITIFKKEWSYFSAPLYAVLEGLFLGGISAFFEAQYPGIVMQAVALTFGTLLVLLFGYKTGVINVTKKFRAGVIAATGAVALVYLISFIFSMFGGQSLILNSNGIIGIGISLVIVVIAALNLVLDFDFIAQASKKSLPKYMEWYSAFGLILTLVWLYIEFLRLLSKLSSRN